MSIWQQLQRVVEDPPPEYAFEVSPAGIAFAQTSQPSQTGFHPLPPDVLSVSPLKDNVQRPEVFQEQVRALVPNPGKKTRRKAAVILPDYCARVAVLDFDAFPKEPAEQQALVKFRVRKSVPFDVESAAVSYHVQSNKTSKRLDVVVAVIALEIVARYEAAFRAAGYHPGIVTTSTLAALEMLRQEGVSVLAKLNNRSLTVAVLENANLKLLRCVELSEPSVDEVMAVLYPTVAYIEDELKSEPQRLLLSGFGSWEDAIEREWRSEFQSPVEPVRSRFGIPAQVNAGLLGYLEGSAH